jgi:hypothetical protein
MVLPMVFFGIFLLLTAAMNRMKRYRLVGMALCVALVITELFRFGWKFTPFTPDAYFFPKTAIINFLLQQPQPFRIMSLDDRILPPNVLGYYGIESAEGYDPLAPKRYEDFLYASERGEVHVSGPTGFNRIYTAHNTGSSLIPYMNVRYVLSLSDITMPNLRKVFQEGETRVYEYLQAKPRFSFADDVRVRPAQSLLSDMLSQPTAGNAAWVSSPIPVLSLPLSADDAMTIRYSRPGYFNVSISVRNSRLTVFSDRYDARWHASVDGKTATIVPVNYLFMGIVIPAGSHTLVLEYR